MAVLYQNIRARVNPRAIWLTSWSRYGNLSLMETDNLLTSTQAGDRLGVTREMVRKMVKQDLLRPAFVSSGGWRYYDPEDVRRLAEKREEDRVWSLVQGEADAMRKALTEYREWTAADLPGDLLNAHVALAAVRLSNALGMSFDLSESEEWGRLASSARLDRKDAELLVEIGEQMAKSKTMSTA